MIDITVDVTSNILGRLASSLDGTLEAALDAGVATCIAVADPLTPVDTGALKGNKSIERGAGSRMITWNQHYAAYQEFGTSRGVPARGFAKAGADAASAVIAAELGKWGR